MRSKYLKGLYCHFDNLYGGDRVGQQLGNYRLLRLLGKGGFAEVYLGEHLRLGTQAAVKVLYTRLASPDEAVGFEKEAQTIAHLKHPHIVRVLDFDVHDDTPFLVMDYAVSGTLRQRHPKGSVLLLPTIINYVKQVAEALQYAHDKKLIHRDVKPENMLLGEREELLLSDFGIALIAQSSRYQGTQEMAGTISYMAPEQIQGHPRQASDQYALGIVVYEWLSGDRPFHGSYREIAVQHTVTPPPPLREKVSTISPDVEQVVMTALAKDPKQRFGSVLAFARALEQASQSDVVSLAKSSVPPTQAEAQVSGVVTPSGSSEVQIPPVVMPSTSTPTLPVTPPSPPRQPTAISRPLGTTLYTYTGLFKGVLAVAWSPDGKDLAFISGRKV
jgi:serine/threonine protein kinase